MNFEEVEIGRAGDYKQIALRDLKKGGSVCFYLADVENRHSQEFGDFTACVGLEIDEHLNSLEEILSEAVCASFIPNTQISNMLNEGLLETNQLYRFVKEWDKGEKFHNGKTAKGYGYNVIKLTLPITHHGKFAATFKKLKYAQAEEVAAEEEVKTPVRSKPRL